MKVLNRIIIVLFFCYAWRQDIAGQALSFDLKKPAKYENRKLASEKTDEKKFTIWRRFTQNGVTKFNWNFNAQQKLDQVLERAKAQHRDDYTRLLSFYNYDLDKTAADRDIDSVIYKANAGILIHDLRNTWIDNLYMLMGKGFYYKKIFDTAYLTFQYVNYIYSPKEKDGYDIPIGSNAAESSGAFTISTKEKTDLFHRVWTRPPSRNESFVWQIRTYLANNELPEAAGMIETLKHDPNFPDRLKTDLKEVQALYFYKQEIYDSAAVYLEQALPNAANKREEARWEYLIAQLYEKVNRPDLASGFYKRAINHTLDPVLELYARLNSIRQNKGDDKVIQENVNALVKMARKDRYTNYRDIIYYMAAQIELERDNVAGAKALLLKATRYPGPEGDLTQKSKAFLQLAELSFNEKNYRDAKRYYDSIATPSVAALGIDMVAFEKRKGVLSKIAENQEIITRQDSLQHLAAMPDAEREAFIRKLAKQLRKQQGLKEEEPLTGGNMNPLLAKGDAPATDLFNDNAKGDWYFYNQSQKSKGYNEFKTKWGNRKNVDNWRRIAAVNQSINNQAAAAGNQDLAVQGGNINTGSTNDFSYDGLLKNIPLTAEQMTKSNDSIDNAQLLVGKTLIEGLEDYSSAITTLEGLLERFPESRNRPEALFHLYYCYSKTGDRQKADAIARELKQKYPGTEFEKIVSNPKGSQADQAAKTDMTKRYETIYNLFIEGSFDEALAQKKIADSLYSTNYWTPQLLYIQSVYHIRQRQDDSARTVLQNILNLYPTSPLAAKAQTMLDVLGRRKQIEDYLTQLKIERPQEDSLSKIIEDAAVKPIVKEPQAAINKPDQKNVTPPQAPPPVVAEKKPEPEKKPVPDKNAIAKKDSQLVHIAPPAPGKPAFTYDPNAPHSVAIVLNKVDRVYVSEARNAYNRYNKEKYYNKVMEVGNQDVNDTLKLVVISPFDNANAAIDYMEKARKVAPTEVVPWLPAGKYSFIIITAPNLELLKNTKDIEAYRQFLTQAFPGKF